MLRSQAKEISAKDKEIERLTKEIVKLKGDKAHPLFKWLKENYNKSPKWNFYKYLFDRNGELVESWSSMTKPTSFRIKNSINKIL